MLALIIAILCVAAIIAVALAALAEARGLRVTHLSLSVPGWPGGAGRARIAHLSDLHLPGIPVSLDRLLGVIRDIDPHLIVVSGDTLAWNADIDIAVSLIRRLAAHAPVLCVTGNSEHAYDLNIEAFGAAIERVGGRLLVNRHWTGTIGGANVCVLGLEHRLTGTPDFEGTLADASPADLMIVVAHSPFAWPRVPRERTHLFLCGHTHGGQLRIPILGRLIAHSRREWELKSGVLELPRHGSDWADLRRVYSHEELCKNGKVRTLRFTSGRPLMCTTRGVGAVILPMRLGSPPEVIAITVGGDMAGDAPGETEVS